ncbi:isopentenyl-diphosphate Delta-isomerase 1-like [Clytia hemisphaerica]|uniref:isopentenyl-diphosphate Delta-isomerase n=1 Tax=Clytia hemisphaerica TaxID=252671 RepID=A0A7M5UVF3_9CNID|eukprot:TCONS_00012552-protein
MLLQSFFPRMHARSPIKRLMSTFLNQNVSQQQIQQLNDQIPHVNSSDEVIGPVSKKDSHVRPQGAEGTGLLHRAFSVFLFNSERQLLLQQRSSSKITFPDYLTNTCCSHPRFNDDELNEKYNVGIKIAAQRRLKFELGITKDQVPLESFTHLTRIHYSGNSDENWCEHEIDHVLICQKDVHLEPNLDEVQKCYYVTQDELETLLRTADDAGILLTPWFRYISNTFLFQWWNNLDDLSSFKDDVIHRAGHQP